MTVPVPDTRSWRRIAELEREVERLRQLVFRFTNTRHTQSMASRTWRFKLLESFRDGEAKADLEELDGEVVKANVTVRDPLLIFETLEVTAGMEGYCEEQINIDGARWYLVIQMECP